MRQRNARRAITARAYPSAPVVKLTCAVTSAFHSRQEATRGSQICYYPIPSTLRVALSHTGCTAHSEPPMLNLLGVGSGDGVPHHCPPHAWGPDQRGPSSPLRIAVRCLFAVAGVLRGLRASEARHCRSVW